MSNNGQCHNANLYEIFRRVSIGTPLRLVLYEGSEKFNGASDHNMPGNTQSYGANEKMKREGSKKIVLIGQLARRGISELMITPDFIGKTPGVTSGRIFVLYNCIEEAETLRASKKLFPKRQEEQVYVEGLEKIIS